MGKSWCSLPFTAVTYYADGAVAPCCKHIGRDTSKNFYTLPPAEALNSPMFVALQEKFLKGEKPDACIKCWNAESQGVPSYRIMSQEKWDWAQTSHPVEKKVKMIDVAFGNLCNAACLTCDTVSSHKWQEESAELLQIEGNPFERSLYRTQTHNPDWGSEDLQEVKVVLFDQSEPFLQPGFKKLIRSLKETGSLQQMSLSLSTNGSYWPDQNLLDDLSQAKLVEIQISVDATGALFEYLRYPLQWSILDAMTNKWVDWAKNKPAIRLIARQTLSALNLIHEPAVRLWWASKTSSALTYGMVHNPWYLAPMALPEWYRQKLNSEGAVHPRVLKTLHLPEAWHETYKLYSEQKRLNLLRDFLTGRERKRGLYLKNICPETHSVIFSEGEPASITAGGLS